MTRPVPHLDAFVAECPTREVLDRISGKWVSLIVVALSTEPSGYRELLRRIEAVSPKMLTQTLRELERDGIVEVCRHDTVPPRSEYRLTALGRTLLPLLAAVKAWAELHLDGVEAARAVYDAAR